MKHNNKQLIKDYYTESDTNPQVGNVAESNILDDSELIFRWPPVSSEIDPGSIRQPNTDVLVERGKKVCSAFFGESFTFGDSIASIIKSVGE